MDTHIKMEGRWYGYKITKAVDDELVLTRRCLRLSTAIRIMGELLK